MEVNPLSSGSDTTCSKEPVNFEKSTKEPVNFEKGAVKKSLNCKEIDSLNNQKLETSKSTQLLPETLLPQIKIQVTFLKNGTKSLPKFTSENLKNKRIDDGCLVGSLL